MDVKRSVGNSPRVKPGDTMNSFGNKFRVSIFGESHGEMIGVTIDGVPAGIPLSADDFAGDLCRRKGGRAGTTPRKETDEPHLVSGVFEGHTTGAPLSIVFLNGNTRSADYCQFNDVPRPGHADRTGCLKWDGMNDPRGGGHFSGRITIALVAAGVVAKKVVSDMVPARINARLVSLGGIPAPSAVHPESVEEEGFPQEWKDAIHKAAGEGDSLGGVAECVVDNMPSGLGEPFFDSLESMIAHIVFAIPGVRGIEFGDGFAAAGMKGSEHNDSFGPDGRPSKNGSGGINGGISNGAPLVFRAAFKPTSSIRKAQNTFNFRTGEMTMLEIGGRHDVCFALRSVVILESVTAIVLADMLLQ